MALEFKAQSFLVSAHIPTYADWFAQCDMEPTYRYERRVLKLLQWKTPEKKWRLKSPTHTMFLDAYQKVFPECTLRPDAPGRVEGPSVGLRPLLHHAASGKPPGGSEATSGN